MNALKKRARRKYLNCAVIEKLVELDSPFQKKYKDSLHCSSVIHVHEGKTSSRYCKRPWCSICNSIRSAVRINKYSSDLDTIQGKQFTTLTIPNVTADNLLKSIKDFKKNFRQFRNTYKKTTGITLQGVYSIEITINFKKQNYHPHFHIIHSPLPPGQHKTKKGNSSILIDYWLSKYPQSVSYAQDTRDCTDYIESIKYLSKTIIKVQENGKQKSIVPATMLDQIYTRLAGQQLFNPFGIRSQKPDEKSEDDLFNELESQESQASDGIYTYNNEIHDWLNKSTGEILTGFVPTEKQKKFYDKLINNGQ